jgi:hypothetical protein
LGNAKTDHKQDENAYPLLPAAWPAPIDALLEGAQAQGVAFLAEYVERQEELEQILSARKNSNRYPKVVMDVTAKAFNSPFGVEKAGSKRGAIPYSRINHQATGNRMNAAS